MDETNLTFKTLLFLAKKEKERMEKYCKDGYKLYATRRGFRWLKPCEIKELING